MATYTLTTGQISAHDKTLVASTVDKVVFPRSVSEVEIISDGAAKIYVRTDGVDPAVSGAFSFLLPAFPCRRVIDLATFSTEVRLISPGAPTYSVMVT